MSPDQIKQFLLIMDVASGETEVRELGTDYAIAVAAYKAAEAEHRDDANYDIVLLGSDSIKTVRRTHSSYFHMTDGRADLRRQLAARATQ